MTVHVIGANGRSGTALCRALRVRGIGFVPVVRDVARWRDPHPGPLPQGEGELGAVRVADVEDAGALRAALEGAAWVVCCAHARFAAAVLAAAPEGARFVFLGSTRKFTRWPDAHGLGVLAGKRAFAGSGRRGVMLHPTMIYGAQGEDNVQRLAALLRRLPVVPLPGGGRALVQPIHQDDVTACILAALAREWAGPQSLVVAGGEALAYADFVRAVAGWAGLAPPRILRVPAWPLILGAPLLGLLPGLPAIGRGEIRRLLEDKAFDTAAMRRELGVVPMRLSQGLERINVERGR